MRYKFLQNIFSLCFTLKYLLKILNNEIKIVYKYAVYSLKITVIWMLSKKSNKSISNFISLNVLLSPPQHQPLTFPHILAAKKSNEDHNEG